MVASTSSTTVSPRSVPATRLAGSRPCRSTTRAHTCQRVRARAASTFFNRAGVNSANARHTVGGEATGPNTSPWWRSTSMSPIASPPSASITATSASTRPRSWVGVNEPRASAADNDSVSPVRSASIRNPTATACATIPVPSPVTDKPADHDVLFTYGVPSSWPFLDLRKYKNPKQDRHFRASTRGDDRSAVNDRG